MDKYKPNVPIFLSSSKKCKFNLLQEKPYSSSHSELKYRKLLSVKNIILKPMLTVGLTCKKGFKMSSWFWVSALQYQFILLHMYRLNLILVWKPTSPPVCSLIILGRFWQMMLELPTAQQKLVGPSSGLCLSIPVSPVSSQNNQLQQSKEHWKQCNKPQSDFVKYPCPVLCCSIEFLVLNTMYCPSKWDMGSGNSLSTVKRV